MRGVGRRLAGVGAVFIVASFVVVGVAAPPASAAERTGWVPSKLSWSPTQIRESFSVSDVGARKWQKMINASVADVLAEGAALDPAEMRRRTQVTAAAAHGKGAYVPGFSDAVKGLGKHPSFVTFDESVEWYNRVHGGSYTEYLAKPGTGGALSPISASNGVYDITSMDKPGKFSKAGKAMTSVAKGAGSALAVVEGVNLVYTLTTTGAQLVGVPGYDATSGSLLCDLSAATGIGGDWACGIAPDPSFPINFDVSAVVPGWTSSPVTRVEGPAGQNMLIGIQSNSEIPFGSTGQPFSYEVSYGYSGTYTQANGLRGSVMLYLRNAAGGNIATSVENLNNPMHWWPDWHLGSHTKPVASKSFTTSANGSSPFDHAVLLNGSDVVATWYPPGHANRPEDVADDPERWWRTIWTCSDGGGGGADSSRFRESEAGWPSPESPSCGQGVVTGVKIWQYTIGLDPELVYEWAPDPGVEQFAQENPECVQGQCSLDLETKKTGKWLSCFSNPSLCTEWLQDPAKETDFRCRYNNKTIRLSDCHIYGPTFDREHATAGDPYGDPITGEPVPVPEGGTDPDPGDGTSPDPGGGTDPGPATDPSCPPKFSWGGLFNPWWYWKATSCALQDVFVPNKANIATQVAKVKETVDTKPPFTLLAPATETINGFKDGWDGGCSQPLADFDPWGQGRLTIPCTPPQSPPLTALYGVAVAGIVGATVFGVWHMLTAAIGGRDAGTGH